MEEPPDPNSHLLPITISNPDQPSFPSCGDDLNSSHHESFSNHSRNYDFMPLLANDKVRTSITLDLASFPLLPSNPPNLNLNSTKNQLHKNPQISMSRTLEIEKSTWASKLGTKGIGKTKLSFIPPTMVNGEPIIHLESSQFGELQQKNENLVIDSFVSKRESFEFVKGIVSKAWKIKGKFTMKFYGRKSFSFAFEDEEDKSKAIEFGNFHIAFQVFLVRPWKLFIEADLKNLEINSIWVLFKKIPEELWNGDGFSRIASAIGEPLYPDRKTEQKTKTDYARICIDVKATSTFPTTIPVVVDKKKVFKVTAEYNWRPPRCIYCKVFGHSESNCSRVQKGKKHTVWAQKETAVAEYAKVIETGIVSEVIEIVEDAKKQHLEVMEDDVQEQESNGDIATSVITPSSPHVVENTDQGEIRNQKESDLEDVVVTSITPMTTSINGGATIQVANGFRFLEDDEEIPESMKSIMEQVDLVNSRMSAFLDKNKGGSSQQSPMVDRVKQKTGSGRGRQKGASSSKTVSDATDESNLEIRKSQREPNAPVRLNL